MRYITNLAASTALLSVAAAGNAPQVTDDPMGITYSATLPVTDANGISGAIKAASAPNGIGTNFQVVFYNLPVGNITYGIYTGRVGSTNPDCSLAGSILNPFNGVSGSACTQNNMQACEIGDLSDKHGSAYVQGGGAGTGYFSDTYIDSYLSTNPQSQAYIGNGSLVIMSTSGTALACADFVNADKPVQTTTTTKGSHTTTGTPMSSTSMSGSMSTTTTGSGSQSTGSSTTTSGNGGARATAMAGIGGGLVGLAALLL